MPLLGTARDEYRRRARLKPMLLIVLPVALAVGLLLLQALGNRGAVEKLGGAMLASIASGFGLTGLLEQIGRDQGKKKEPGLWARWGGAPTTRMLRHRDTAMCNPLIRERYHAKLGRLLSDVHLPSPEEESADPEGADRIYEACTRFLINATRDQARFPLIFEENVNYGFRRNLWGMRGAGLAFAAAGTLFSGWVTCAATGRDVWPFGATIVFVDAGLLTWWLVRITPAWVFIPAKAYAERLLEACDSL